MDDWDEPPGWVCQICGIAFAIGRIRTPDEPTEASWSVSKYGAYEDSKCDCQAEGCASLRRRQATQVLPNGVSRSPELIIEHIAGRHCMPTRGYAGNRISVDEMKDSSSFLLIMQKTPDWKPDTRAEQFVIESRQTWVTGVSKGPPTKVESYGFEPPLHGVSTALISSGCNDDTEGGMPVHAYCFSIFKKMSSNAFGRIRIDDLRRLWKEKSEDWYKPADLPFSEDECIVDEDRHYCTHCTEYLVAHPLQIPELDRLIKDCSNDAGHTSEVTFTAGANGDSDPFWSLPPELRLMILRQLLKKDVASMRLSSRSFAQLPQAYFHDLVRTEMPWVLWDIPKNSNLNWYKLWCELREADGGSCSDEPRRFWFHKVKYGGLQWNDILKRLTQEERDTLDEYGDMSVQHDKFTVPREYRGRERELVRAREATGEHLPSVKEIKGLRNRRRIYNRVRELLEEMEARDAESASESDASDSLDDEELAEMSDSSDSWDPPMHCRFL